MSVAQAATTFTVDSTGDAADHITTDGVCDTDDSADDGPCTLRAAIEQANASGGTDTINFNIPGGGPHTIQPASELPDITDPVVIDGYSQPGASVNTNPTSAGSNAVLMIELDGTNAGQNVDGLSIKGGGSVVRGLVINRFREDVTGDFGGHGIVLDITGTNVIEGNFIGTNVAGTADLGNEGSGVAVFTASGGNFIGGTNAAQRNVISGNNATGVQLTGAGGNFVEGNLIGTNAAGTAPIGNSFNGVLAESSNNTIGGTTAAARNLISGNVDPGVAIGPLGGANKVEGNYIGTDITGTIVDPDAVPGNGDDLGNDTNGVVVRGPNNTIGGTTGTTPEGPCTGACNVISGNGFVGNYPGLVITEATATGNKVEGNFIGTDVSGTLDRGNADAGLLILQGASNTIGGTTAEAGNLISGNDTMGVLIWQSGSTGNSVVGNYIGTDISGASDLGNAWDGVRIEDAPTNTIGGTTAEASNLISGNDDEGVEIRGTSATGNKIQGNDIGTDADGTGWIPNTSDGVLITDSPSNVVGWELGTSVQGECPQGCNRISHNGSDGVEISGATAIGNTVRGNSILDNDGLGINLIGGANERADGVTPNDTDDSDSGPNGYMNFPVGVTAYFNGTNTIISGLLPTGASAFPSVDIYANRSVDPSGFGEGERYLGSPATITDAGTFVLEVSGPLEFTVDGSPPVPFPFVSAVAIDATGSSSEFSPVCGDPDGNGSTDNDGDSLCDDWERDGIDFDGDDNLDLRLALSPFNADPDHKDIFVEIDYMTGLQPDPGAIQDVEAAFAGAPVPNPDSSLGIDLHLMVDEPLPVIDPISFASRQPGNADDFDDLKIGSNGSTPGDPCGIADIDGHFGTLTDRAALNCDAILGAKRLVFRYTMFAFNFTARPGSSGRAEGGGNDFIVTLGGWPAGNITKAGGQRVAESGTLMHEMGHTLGLCHGGSLPATIVSCTDDPGGSFNQNRKPNYLSIMNYLFQFANVVPGRPLDYSRWDLSTLNEAALDETHGIDSDSPPGDLAARWPRTAHTAYDAASDKCLFRTAPTVGDIDWDGSGGIDLLPVQAGINDPDNEPDSGGPEACQTSNNEPLAGSEDWLNLHYNFRISSDFEDGARFTLDPTPDEVTTDDVTRDAQLADFDIDGISNFDDNCPAWYNPGQNLPPWQVPLDDGDCDGFTATLEGLIPTDAVDACPDDSLDDAWPPDVNNDAAVDILDLSSIRSPFGTLSGDPGYWARVDLNADGQVNILDLSTVATFFGLTCT